MSNKMFALFCKCTLQILFLQCTEFSTSVMIVRYECVYCMRINFSLFLKTCLRKFSIFSAACLTGHTMMSCICFLNIMQWSFYKMNFDRYANNIEKTRTYKLRRRTMLTVCSCLCFPDKFSNISNGAPVSQTREQCALCVCSVCNSLRLRAFQTSHAPHFNSQPRKATILSSCSPSSRVCSPCCNFCLCCACHLFW